MARTSERIATLAAKGLAEPASLNPQEIREVCASALAQAEGEIAPQLPVKRPSGAGFIIEP